MPESLSPRILSPDLKPHLFQVMQCWIKRESIEPFDSYLKINVLKIRLHQFLGYG